MKLVTAFATLVAAAVMGTAAFAAEVAPDAVEFTDDGVKTSLTGVAGNAEEGAKIFKGGKLGNCLACHENKAMSKELFHGNVGPSLDGVASRYTVEQLRAIIVDSKKALTEETVMPGFYSLKVGFKPREEFAGKTVLTAQEVEDVLAYVATLKE